MSDQHVVWKYRLDERPPDGVYEREIPAPATVLHVGEDQHEVCVWVLVRPDARAIIHRFHVVGTGIPVAPVALVHHGSVRLSNQRVWHVFTEN